MEGGPGGGLALPPKINREMLFERMRVAILYLAGVGLGVMPYTAPHRFFVQCALERVRSGVRDLHAASKIREKFPINKHINYQHLLHVSKVRIT